MLDYGIMGGILIFLIFILAFKSKYVPDGNNGFFDINNSKAIRGFWCLIVILVHIPQAYQNKIQDMIGSFAYIGVTFFFMTSAYGLSIATNRKPDSINRFWRTRLPKLIIPNWLINIIFSFAFLIAFNQSFGIVNIFNVNLWVVWLLGCYLVFWLCNLLIHNKKFCNFLICALVSAISLTFYIMRATHIINSGTWCPESIGFIWGILLFANYDRIKAFFTANWIIKVIASLALSLTLGLAYLKFKPVIFWGDYILKIALGLSILSFILILNSKIKIGNKIIYFLGDISFEVYLIHTLAFKIIKRTIPSISSGLFISSSIILTVLLAVGIHYLSNMILKKIRL